MTAARRPDDAARPGEPTHGASPGTPSDRLDEAAPPSGSAEAVPDEDPPGTQVRPAPRGAAADPDDWQRFERQGEVHPAMLEDIRRARHSIDLEQFIFRYDSIGRDFVDALVERAERGVRVRVLVDALGSNDLLLSDGPDRLRRSGGEFKVFHAPHRIVHIPVRRLSRRTHRKILVIDGRVGHVGGAGISEAMTSWRDVNLRLGGPVVDELVKAFEFLWQDERPPWDPIKPPIEDGSIHFLSTATARKHSPIYDHILEALRGARRQVTLTTPYFVPDARFRRAIAEACARGVEVRLLVPEQGDQLPADALTWWASVRVMRLGAKVWTWPAMMHGKVQVVDDRWATVGSSNLDCLSFFGNEEGNIVAARTDLATDLRRAVDEDLDRADPMTEARWRARPAWRKAAGWAFRPLRPFL